MTATPTPDDGAPAPSDPDAPTPDDPDDDSSPGPGDVEWTYVESTIIMTTVRVIAPFVLTFGLFISLHGADSPGGGFQGGVVIASVLVMIAFAFGTAPTRDWLRSNLVVGLTAGGVAVFVAIGLGTVVLGGQFLEYWLYGGQTASKYAIELVELGIAATVVGVVTTIFFLLEQGPEAERGDSS
jgi:multicomponent Na+:H+ antiporter subunit B